jgi:hypothetical protein
MDAAGLQNLFSQGNPFLAQMGEQAWNQDQAKAQQALLTAQGEEQRKQAMQPLEMAHKQATTGYNQALTSQLANKQAGDLPANERMTLAMSEYRKKMSDAQAAEEDTKMQRRMQYAEMAAKNGGVLPLEYLNQLDASERGHFANPKAVATTQQLAKAWYDTHPKTIEAKRKQESELERARVMAASRAAGRTGGGAGGAKNMSAEQAMTHYNKLAMAESDSDLRAQYQAEADRNELIALRFRQASAQARGEQGLDIPATVAGGKPVNKPQTTPTPTPRDGGKPKPGSSPDNPIILK